MTEFLQIFLAGAALGARYALVALGFVIIYKATGVINFAQGALLEKELDHEDGELTATQKVKRRAIEEQFTAEIEGLYA